MKKKVIIIGGGTFNFVRNHLALAAPAFGETASIMYDLAVDRFPEMDVQLILTKMADSNSKIVSSKDLEYALLDIINDNLTKVVVFNAAVCDYMGEVDETPSDKYSNRLETSDGVRVMKLYPANKLVKMIREKRKDILVVAFKTTCNATEAEQFAKGLNLLKKSSANLVLCNDVFTKNNIIVTPEEGVYRATEHPKRLNTLKMVLDMAYWRSHLSFTRSTVVDGEAVKWESDLVPDNLRQVVNWCVEKNAYKVFNGVTTGHFAAKIGDGEFITSIRKRNFNDLPTVGMVRVKTDGDDKVISYGMKPSVGGQSQRIIFDTFRDTDCIVHFHCPLRSDAKDAIPVVSQKEYECGSHECGQNTANGLGKFGEIYAVMLDNHGPNIVFSKHTKPEDVISFVERNFDLAKSTSGFEQVYFN